MNIFDKFFLLINFFFKFKFIKFLLVGSFNTILSMITFSLIYFIGLHYFIATTINLILGIFIAFNTHSRITFNSQNNAYEKFTFFALGFYLLINILLYFAEQNNYNIYLSYIIILIPCAISNFFILKKFVFNSN